MKWRYKSLVVAVTSICFLFPNLLSCGGGAKTNEYDVSCVTNSLKINVEKVKSGENLNAVMSLNNDYRSKFKNGFVMPTTINVTINDVPFNDFNYEVTEDLVGVIKIDAAKINGPIKIVADVEKKFIDVGDYYHRYVKDANSITLEANLVAGTTYFLQACDHLKQKFTFRYIAPNSNDPIIINEPYFKATMTGKYQLIASKSDAPINDYVTAYIAPFANNIETPATNFALSANYNNKIMAFAFTSSITNDPGFAYTPIVYRGSKYFACDKAKLLTDLLANPILCDISDSKFPITELIKRANRDEYVVDASEKFAFHTAKTYVLISYFEDIPDTSNNELNIASGIEAKNIDKKISLKAGQDNAVYIYLETSKGKAYFSYEDDLLPCHDIIDSETYQSLNPLNNTFTANSTGAIAIYHFNSSTKITYLMNYNLLEYYGITPAGTIQIDNSMRNKGIALSAQSFEQPILSYDINAGDYYTFVINIETTSQKPLIKTIFANGFETKNGTNPIYRGLSFSRINDKTYVAQDYTTPNQQYIVANNDVDQVHFYGLIVAFNDEEIPENSSIKVTATKVNKLISTDERIEIKKAGDIDDPKISIPNIPYSCQINLIHKGCFLNSITVKINGDKIESTYNPTSKILSFTPTKIGKMEFIYDFSAEFYTLSTIFKYQDSHEGEESRGLATVDRFNVNKSTSSKYDIYLRGSSDSSFHDVKPKITKRETMQQIDIIEKYEIDESDAKHMTIWFKYNDASAIPDVDMLDILFIVNADVHNIVLPSGWENSRINGNASLSIRQGCTFNLEPISGVTLDESKMKLDEVYITDKLSNTKFSGNAKVIELQYEGYIKKGLQLSFGALPPREYMGDYVLNDSIDNWFVYYEKKVPFVCNETSYCFQNAVILSSSSKTEAIVVPQSGYELKTSIKIDLSLLTYEVTGYSEYKQKYNVEKAEIVDGTFHFTLTKLDEKVDFPSSAQFEFVEYAKFYISHFFNKLK